MATRMALSYPLDVRADDRQRVLTKIKSFMVDWLDQLAGGELPSFEIRNNGEDDDLANPDSGESMVTSSRARTVTKKLILPEMGTGESDIARAMNACTSYTSILCVLSFSMRLLENGKTATMREIYYAFVKHFTAQTQCNDAILDCCNLLGEPRHCLGIVASSRGYISGRIAFRGEGFDDWQDPRSTGGNSGLAITADWLTRPLELKSDARYILVVEKDCVFNRLVEDGFHNRIPSILVTGQGFPPLAVRACVFRLADALDLPVLGLFDCNPFGLSVLLTYKEGSLRQGPNATKYAVPTLKWLGLRPSQLDDLDLPQQVHQQLSQLDVTRARSVSRSTVISENPDTYGEEAAYWLSQEREATKVELEALYTLGIDALTGRFLETAIIREDYI